MGIPPSPRILSKALKPAWSRCHLASRLCARSFLYTVAPAAMCFVFIVFLWVLFFSHFLYFLARRRQRPSAHRRFSASSPAVGSFSGLRSSRLPPFSSVSARCSVLSAPSSVGYSLPLQCLSSTPLLFPAFLPLSPFFYPSSPPLCPHFFPSLHTHTPTHPTRISPLVPSLPPTASHPPLAPK